MFRESSNLILRLHRNHILEIGRLFTQHNLPYWSSIFLYFDKYMLSHLCSNSNTHSSMSPIASFVNLDCNHFRGTTVHFWFSSSLPNLFLRSVSLYHYYPPPSHSNFSYSCSYVVVTSRDIVPVEYCSDSGKVFEIAVVTVGSVARCKLRPNSTQRKTNLRPQRSHLRNFSVAEKSFG
jgi:hypothetical protein